jgi:hypothetical protein
MARLMIGIILEICFVLGVVGGLVSRHYPTTAMILALTALLLVPGGVLIALGIRRIALFKRVGAVVIAAARQTGQIIVDEIARETRTKPARVRLVVDTLVRKGIIGPGCSVL